MAKDLEAKAKAREERNKAQAIEETAIWQDITVKAEKAVTLARAKMGRPSSYRPEIADEIVTRMAEGQSLNSICKTICQQFRRFMSGRQNTPTLV